MRFLPPSLSPIDPIISGWMLPPRWGHQPHGQQDGVKKEAGTGQPGVPEDRTPKTSVHGEFCNGQGNSETAKTFNLKSNYKRELFALARSYLPPADKLKLSTQTMIVS